MKSLFNSIVGILSEIKSVDDIESAKNRIEDIVQDIYSKLKKRQLSIKDLQFRVQLNKNLDQYVKTTPQHVKAARLLVEKKGVELGAGDLISFVKTKGSVGVKPIDLAEISEIDIDKYLAQMNSTLTHVLDPI